MWQRYEGQNFGIFQRDKTQDKTSIMCCVMTFHRRNILQIGKVALIDIINCTNIFLIPMLNTNVMH